MQNLRDKLLKAGLVSKEQTEAAEAEKQRKAEEAKRAREQRRDNVPRGQPAARPSGAAARPPAREAPIPKLPPLALPGSKAFQRLEALKQLELDKKIREIVRAGEAPVEAGEVKFHFMTRKGKLRRLEMTEGQQKLLEEGKLAVVERPEPGSIEHSLVTRETAELLLPLSEKAVRFYNRDGKPIGFLSDDEMKSDVSTEAEANDAELVAAAPEEPAETEEKA
ncbi:MAG: DUF2058 family protein, partial [Myxococcaceae bacterium]